MRTVPAKAGPTVTSVTAPFWDGLRDGQLLLRRCSSCGRAQHHPRVLCRDCWSSDLSWTESAATGTVWTWTVVQPPGHPVRVGTEARDGYAVAVARPVPAAEGRPA
ncbi:MAG: zinc ribbon domain-containing protein [Sporichthyaceae bacterium]